MRLIDANRLKQNVLDWEDCYNGFSDTYDKARIIDEIDAQPTIDAEPIVRCKDCKHFDGSYPMCCRFEEEFKPDDYCSFGEKIDEDAD